jgi:chemotaxis regulatin CheY-phosphate phosphatase CheZ
MSQNRKMQEQKKLIHTITWQCWFEWMQHKRQQHHRKGLPHKTLQQTTDILILLTKTKQKARKTKADYTNITMTPQYLRLTNSTVTAPVSTEPTRLEEIIHPPL